MAATAEPARPGTDNAERRAFWRAAIIMTGALVVLIGLFVVFYPSPGKGLTEQQQIQQAKTQAPQIIPSPANGRAPTHDGDPGGWEQVLLFFVMVGGMLTVGGLAWRASRRAKREAAAPPRSGTVGVG